MTNHLGNKSGTFLWLVVGVLTCLLVPLLAKAQTTNPSDWSSLSVIELNGVADAFIHQGPSANAQLGQLGDYAANRLAQDLAAHNVSWNDWSLLLSKVGPQMTGQGKTAWITALRNAYTTPEAITALNLNAVESATRILSTLGDPQASNLLATWVGGNDLSQIGAKDLGYLAKCLSGTTATDAAARQQLTAAVQSTYLSDASKISTVSINNWDALVTALNKDISAQNKAAWISALRGQFGTSAALTSASANDVRTLARALTILGDQGSTALWADWVSASDKWKDLNSGEMTVLVKAMHGNTAGEAAARLRVADQIQTQYLASVAGTRQVADWAATVGGLNNELTPERRNAWAASLRAAYSDAASQAALTLSQAQNIARALKTLGDANFNDLMVSYIANSSTWQSQSTLPQILALAGNAKSGQGEIGNTARQRLREYVEATYLKDSASVQLVPPANWMELSQIAQGADAATLRKWSQAIEQTYASSDTAISAMPAANARTLASAVKALDPDLGVKIAAAWLRTHSDRTQTPANQWKVLALTAAQGHALDPTQSAAILTDLENVWNLANQPPMEVGDMLGMADLATALGNTPKAQEWVQKAYQAALGTETAQQTVSLGTLQWLIFGLRDAKLLAPDKDHPELMTALTRAISQNKPAAEYWPFALAKVYLTATARQGLRAQLVGGNGEVRSLTGMVLSHAYRNSGEQPAWNAYLDQQVAAPESTGDPKAAWLLLRGYSETVLDNDQRSPMRGKKWLDQAWTTAQSDAMKLQVLGELVDGYNSIGQQDQALSLLQSVKSQFSSQPSLWTVQLLQDQTQLAKTLREVNAAGQKNSQEVAALNARKVELTSRMDAARARGDNQAVARYQKLLDQVK